MVVEHIESCFDAKDSGFELLRVEVEARDICGSRVEGQQTTCCMYNEFE
jgi:hypothetical protein